CANPVSPTSTAFAVAGVVAAAIALPATAPAQMCPAVRRNDRRLFIQSTPSPWLVFASRFRKFITRHRLTTNYGLRWNLTTVLDTFIFPADVQMGRVILATV